MAFSALLSLPIELLLIVLNDDDLKPSDLIHIARCCKALYRIALPLTVRDITIYPTFVHLDGTIILPLTLANCMYLARSIETLWVIDAHERHTTTTANWASFVTFLSNLVSMNAAPKTLYIEAGICMQRCYYRHFNNITDIGSVIAGAFSLLDRLRTLDFSNVSTTFACDILNFTPNMDDLRLWNVRCPCGPHEIYNLAPKRIVKLDLLADNDTHLSNTLLQLYAPDIQILRAQWDNFQPHTIKVFSHLEKLEICDITDHATFEMLLKASPVTLKVLNIQNHSKNRVCWYTVTQLINKFANFLQSLQIAHETVPHGNSLWTECFGRMKVLRAIKLDEWPIEMNHETIATMPTTVEFLKVKVVASDEIEELVKILKDNVYRVPKFRHFRIEKSDTFDVFEFDGADNWVEHYGIAAASELDRITFEIIWDDDKVYKREGI